MAGEPDDDLKRLRPQKSHRSGPRRDRPDDGEPGPDWKDQREALDAFAHDLVVTLDLLITRSCARLGALWCLQSGTFLEQMREEMGIDPKDVGRLERKEYKHAHLAAGLYLAIFLGELEHLGPAKETERKLIENAYLPSGGGTDKEPYKVYRLPDDLLAERVLGHRTREAVARDRLKNILLDVVESWWDQFRGSPLAAGDPRDILVARLAHALFRPTVFEAFRLERLRPAGRGELDFVEWRGETVKPDRKPRGRPPGSPMSGGGAAPPPTPATLRSFARMELPEADRSRIAEYLVFHASATELEAFEEITRLAPRGAELFERLRAGAMTTRAPMPSTPLRVALMNLGRVLRRLLRAPAVRFFMTEDHMIPGFVMFDAEEGLGEAVVLDVRGASRSDWIVVFARIDHGPLTCEVEWQLAADFPPMFFPPAGAKEVEVLAAITTEELRPRESETDPVRLLEQLGPRRVRWAASRFDV